MNGRLLFTTGIAMTIAFGGLAPAMAKDKQPPVVRTPAESAIWRAAQTDDLTETSLRYMFRHNGSGLGEMADAYYVMVPRDGGMGDPTNDFLSRLANVNPPVKKGSLCNTKGAVTDIKRGTSGILFFVEEVTWKSDEEVYVDGGYMEDVANSARTTCLLKQKRGRWTVAKYGEHDPRASTPDAPDPPAAPAAPAPAPPAATGH